jgi:hypothetical protein
LDGKMVSDPPKVFISYSHDSTEHAEAVLALAQRLRQDGVDAWIDQYENGTPEEGWPRWMLNRLDWAQTVLLVCTQTYYRRFRGHDDPDKGKGADWEGQLITLDLYDAKSKKSEFRTDSFLGSLQRVYS